MKLLPPRCNTSAPSLTLAPTFSQSCVGVERVEKAPLTVYGLDIGAISRFWLLPCQALASR
jgi:hypothetical protein